MATTKWKIMQDVTTGGSMPDSKLVYKAVFKKGDIVEGEEIDNPNYSVGMMGGAAPKVVRVQTPSGPVIISNTPSLGPAGVFIAPFESALPSGLPELPVKKDSAVVSAPSKTSSASSESSGANWTLRGALAGLVIGSVVAIAIKKYSGFWYYSVLVFMLVGGVAGRVAETKMKKIA
jgi:hypothetical protein